MRKVVLFLALLFVIELVLLLKSGGSGGRAEPRAPPVEEAAPEAPSVREPTRAATWRATGAVAAGRGDVEILIEWDDVAGERLAKGTIRDGRFAVDLPALAEMPVFVRSRARVYASVFVSGYLPGRSEPVALKGREPGEIRLDVSIQIGAVARGRVVDETGTPVPDADVWLSPEGALGETDADGAFALPVGREGSSWVCARCGDLGVAVAGPFRLSRLDGHDAGDLVLRGPGRISGVAVYPDGTPVREMQLVAVPESLRESKISSWPDPAFHPATEGVPEGLRWGWTTTDAEGRFLIRGLRAGKYFFLDDKGRTVYETGTDVRVTIDLYRILVRVVEEDGAPAPGTCVSAKGGGDSAAGAIEDLDVTPGQVWTIAIGDMDVVPTSATVNVIPEQREYEARLVARPVTAKGSVEVRLLDPRKKPMEPRVSLYAGTLCLMHERPVDAAGRTAEVPVGEYRVVAIAKDPLAPYLAVEGTATVRAGAATPLTLEARAGGRLRLTLKGGPAGEEIRDERITAHPAQGRDAVNFVPLHVREDGSYTIGYEWRWGEPTTGWLLLEPGPHELRVAVPGFEPVAVGLHVQPEATTDAEVTLVPAK
jgi:hypothetical protein